MTIDETREIIKASNEKRWQELVKIITEGGFGNEVVELLVIERMPEAAYMKRELQHD